MTMRPRQQTAAERQAFKNGFRAGWQARDHVRPVTTQPITHPWRRWGGPVPPPSDVVLPCGDCGKAKAEHRFDAASDQALENYAKHGW